MARMTKKRAIVLAKRQLSFGHFKDAKPGYHGPVYVKCPLCGRRVETEAHAWESGTTNEEMRLRLELVDHLYRWCAKREET